MEGEEASTGAVQVTSNSRGGRVTKSVAKRTAGKAKTPTLAKGVSPQGSEIGESGEEKVEESKEEVGEAQVVESTMGESREPTEVGEAQVMELRKEEPSQVTAESAQEPVEEEGQAEKVDEPVIQNVGESALKEQSIVEPVIISSENSEDSLEQENPGSMEVTVVLNNEVSGRGRDEEEAKKEQKESRDGGDKQQLDFVPSNTEEDVKEELQREKNEPVKEVDCDEEMGYGEKVDLGENGDEDLREDDVDDPAEETKEMEEEQKELSAIVKERKSRKEREVFVGGLDRDAVEEDVRKVFEKIGEIVEIRLHKNLSTNKNKGYAFVEYAKKEHAIRALSEMKNPVVCICSTCFPPNLTGLILIFSN